MDTCGRVVGRSVVGIVVMLVIANTGAAAEAVPAATGNLARELESLRLAIVDLTATFPDQYRRGPEFLQRLDAVARRAGQAGADVRGEVARLKEEALLANPLIAFDRLIVLKRKRGQLGLPTNHQCNTALKQTAYDNEIAVLSPVRPDGKLHTLYRPDGRRFVGEIDLHYDAQRLLFTMPNGQTWQIHEIGVDGSGLRQVSREEPDVDNFDGCYLPDGRIVFASTASFTGVPCWHGKERACSLYSMHADGSGVRQLCFDQDLDLHPSVLSNGQVIYSRWDYTGIMHVYLRPLMVMNPDGTLQRAVYGSNSYYPNSLFYPRAIPGHPTKVAAILSGYHGVNRMGELVVLDTAQGWHEADGIIARVGHRGEPAMPVIRDDLVSASWPKFLHPYPLNDKYFVAAVWPGPKSPWGIYLVDVFDNLLPLAVDEKYDFFEPIPVQRTPQPPVIPDRVDTTRQDAVVYLHNVYAGPGLAGVPRGAVKRLRIAAYHYGYPGMAGPDKVGRAGPWDVMRILGTVPVHEDGSAAFRVPACTPITVQPLDDRGRALALMRSWYTAMPGETASCVGCHEQPRDTPVTRHDIAATRPPVEIEPWYGPPRGFDFEREVQPVLDKYCVGCHNGQPRDDGRQIVDLRGELSFVGMYTGLPLSKLGASRLDPTLRDCPERFASARAGAPLDGRSQDAVHAGLRGAGPTDPPREYRGLRGAARAGRVPRQHERAGADAGEGPPQRASGRGSLGSAGDLDRLERSLPRHVGRHRPDPAPADRRRRELAQKHGGPQDDPETVPAVHRDPVDEDLPVLPGETPRPRVTVAAPGWPCDAAECVRRQRSGGQWQKTIDLGQGVSLPLVRIPAGQFVMGSNEDEADEYPPSRVAIRDDFWMSACEITNEQFRQFAADHFSGYFMKRSFSNDGPGIDLNGPRQPVVRVSWQQAMAFCRWLSQRTGLRFTLPSEAQWEYACRAGSASPLNYGDVKADFSRRANVADASLPRIYSVTGGVVVLQDFPAEERFDDGVVVTANVGSYEPNVWGLYDMHGNAAEWTRSRYRPYPFLEDARDADGNNEPMVVRGGSFHDRPQRCRSGFRLSYPAWQRVHNVGFRVVSTQDRFIPSVGSEREGSW